MSTALLDPNSLPDAAGFEPARDPVASSIAEKWQGAVTQGSGFVAIPMALLRLQTKLKLSQTDMMVLINLLAHWWDPARAVFPRSSTIAKRLGVTKRTVQRSTQKMLDSGLITRDFLNDGKRVFYFDSLAARLAKDIGLSLQIKGQESLDM